MHPFNNERRLSTFVLLDGDALLDDLIPYTSGNQIRLSTLIPEMTAYRRD